MRRSVRASLAALLVACGIGRMAFAGPSSLTDADRKQFEWFDGIGLPRCSGKPYVRFRWIAEGASPSLLAAGDVWEVDGFVVEEVGDKLTVLDGDLWPRKVTRKPAATWTGGYAKLPLAPVVKAATSRLIAMRTDPGAVEGMDQLFRGIHLKFGDEAQAVALARHAAENGLEAEAHALLEAARALPPAAGSPPGAFEERVAGQMAESVLWRIVFDFADAEIHRERLLARLQGWKASFPASPHVGRADAMLKVLPGMVAEDAARSRAADADLARLPPADQAKALVRRLCDQTGDVYMGRDGRVSIGLGDASSPAQRLVALGVAAGPVLVEAVTDARLTRAVCFARDMAFRRLVVARVGDVARVCLEQIAKRGFWDVPLDEPSMFQHDAAEKVQQECRQWLESQATAAGGGK